MEGALDLQKGVRRVEAILQHKQEEVTKARAENAGKLAEIRQQDAKEVILEHSRRCA